MRRFCSLVFLIAATACPPAATDLCNDDRDCSVGLCLDGRCQLPTGVGDGEGEGEVLSKGEGEGEVVGEVVGEGEGEVVGEGEGEGEPPAVCNNLRIETGEECDDGGNVDGDGCTADCLKECAVAGADLVVRTRSGCLAFFEARAVYGEALARCADLGGHLAVPEDADEVAAVVDFAFREPWLGVHDLFAEGTYVTMTGEPVDMSMFGAGEPNNQGDEDCVELRSNGWNDENCRAANSFICEVPERGRACDDAADCNDGLACSGVESCSAGRCRLGGAVPCQGADRCLLPTFDEPVCGACVDDLECDDRDFCTGTEACSNFRCQDAVDEPCGLTDACAPGGCGSAAVCTADGTCVPNAWHAGEPNNDNGTQDCMQMFYAGGPAVGWDDVECATRLAYACSVGVTGAFAVGDFFVVGARHTFAEAEGECVGAGGSLVSDRTLARHADLVEAVYTVGPLWLGGVRQTVMGTTFMWRDDGSVVPLP